MQQERTASPLGFMLPLGAESLHACPRLPRVGGKCFWRAGSWDRLFFPLDNVRAQFHLMGTRQQEGVIVAASFLPPHTAEFRGLKIVELSLRGTAGLHLTGGTHSFGPVLIHPSIHSCLSPSPFYHHCFSPLLGPPVGPACLPLSLLRVATRASF